MVYHGFCNKQKRNYSVEFEKISTSTLEDEPNKFENGRLICEFSSVTGCCHHPRQCSILNSIKE